MSKEISKLNNDISYIYRYNENTPRMAVCLNMSINNPEKSAGIYPLMAKLFLQGTKNYNSEELATELEKYAIDLSCEVFPNYLQFKFVCLNEDFPKAIELMNDIITNTTFDEFEKERVKSKGEISAELDSPRAITTDSYYKTMFENHYYGNTMTKVLENLDNLSKQDIIDAYQTILNSSRKVLAIVGSLKKDEVLPLVEDTIGKLPKSVDGEYNIEKPVLTGVKKVENVKADINQAHILKGWQVPTYGEADYPALVLLNIILGACGLSSRLFLELRDKKGLAYVVRSSYETYKYVGNFMIYIATEAKNIDVSLKGFNEEISKIRNYPVSEKELEDAKNNLNGKCAFLEETNLQQACAYAKYGVIGFDFDYTETLKKEVQKVTREQVLECAKKYFTEDKYVLSITKP